MFWYIYQIYIIQSIKKATDKLYIAFITQRQIAAMQLAVLVRLENESQNPPDFIFLFAAALTSKFDGTLPNKKKPNFRLAFHAFVPYGLQLSNFFDDFERTRIFMNSHPQKQLKKGGILP